MFSGMTQAAAVTGGCRAYPVFLGILRDRPPVIYGV